MFEFFFYFTLEFYRFFLQKENLKKELKMQRKSYYIWNKKKYVAFYVSFVCDSLCGFYSKCDLHVLASQLQNW